jgi:uncharacterized protein (DUF433 family)
MSSSQLLSRISIYPNICVSLILDFLASGMTIPEVLEEYPQLQTEDILACIFYGAEMSRDA